MHSFPRYIYQADEWPNVAWDAARLAPRLAEIHFRRGVLLASMAALGFEARQQSQVLTLVQDVTKSSKIEGEHLDAEQVRSSVARRLGLEAAGLNPVNRAVEGVVEMMLDATQRFEMPLTKARLFGWHSALFPTGHSGMHRIEVARWRTDKLGPMQVVGGPLGRQTVYFQAPAAVQVPGEMEAFLKWLRDEQTLDPVIKAAVAHLRFLTIHPFEDGNGRIARAITDLLLAQADGTSERFYSMSAQIEAKRAGYYTVLTKTQRARHLEITPWLEWFLDRLADALGQAETVVEKVRLKRCFWDKHRETELNVRQRRALELLFEDFFGKLKTQKYATLMRCSTATAQRDLADLVEQGALEQTAGASGRSTSYTLNLDGCERAAASGLKLYRPNRR